MAKNNRKFSADNIKTVDIFEDDYENFGYDIQNANRSKRRNKRQNRFKDYDNEYEWA